MGFAIIVVVLTGLAAWDYHRNPRGGEPLVLMTIPFGIAVTYLGAKFLAWLEVATPVLWSWLT